MTAAAPRDERTDPSTRRALALGLLVGMPLSALFLWLAFRNADVDGVRQAVSDARPGPLLLGIGCLLAVYVAQAARWRLIAATARPGLERFVEMVVSGVACNNILPGRVGELFRARWLAVSARIPGGRAFSSVVIDRSCDVATLVAFLLLGSVAVADTEWLRRIALGGVLVLTAFGLLLFLARVYTRRRARGRLTHRGLVRRLVRDTIEGLAEPITGRRLVTVGVLSVAAWTTWSLGAWLVARSLGIELTLTESIFTTAVLNLGVALPSSPGFVGTYQWLAVAALSLFGIADEAALAFSIVLQAAWYVPTTLVGGAVLVWRGIGRVRTSPAQIRLAQTEQAIKRDRSYGDEAASLHARRNRGPKTAGGTIARSANTKK